MPKRKPEKSSDGENSGAKRKCTEDEDDEEEDMEVMSETVCSCFPCLICVWIIARFPELLLLSGVLCLMRLDVFSRPLHMRLP